MTDKCLLNASITGAIELPDCESLLISFDLFKLKWN